MKLLLILFFSTIELTAQVDTNSWAKEKTIPLWAKQLFIYQKLDQQYEFTFPISPVFLSGDFDGDGITDIAIIVRDKKDNDRAIAIFNNGTHDVFILEATPGVIETDYYGSFDGWRLFSKNKKFQPNVKDPPKLVGDGIFIDKIESGGALIYWNSNDYCIYIFPYD
jgi:hypothetical protein